MNKIKIAQNTLAFHEAGHAVMYWILGIPIKHVSLPNVATDPEGEYWGGVEPVERRQIDMLSPERKAMIYLSGHMAAYIFLPQYMISPDADLDLKKLAKLGLPPASVIVGGKIFKKVERLLDAHPVHVKALAVYLLKVRGDFDKGVTMLGDAVEAMFRGIEYRRKKRDSQISKN